jgi:hypothetical protein
MADKIYTPDDIKGKPLSLEELQNVQDTAAKLKSTHNRVTAIGTAAAAGLSAAAIAALLRTGLFMRNQVVDATKPIRPTRQPTVKIPILKSGAEEGTVGKFIGGRYASSPMSDPITVPLAVGSLAAGSFLGWKVMDRLAKKRRRQVLEANIRDAESDLEAAMLERQKQLAAKYKTAEQKMAFITGVLGELYDRMEKAAFNLESEIGGPVGTATGLYAGLYAVPAAAIAAFLVHGASKKRNRSIVRDKAEKMKERQDALKQLPSLTFQPKVVTEV